MCGRFVVARASSELVELFEVDRASDDLPGPSYNIAPTQSISIIVDAAEKQTDRAAEDCGPPVIRRLESARWGLVPGWATDASAAPAAVNARIESAAEKPSFRDAVVARRAAIPASGYYEWRPGADGGKTLNYFHARDEVILFAGLYEWWRRPGAAADDPSRWMLSATILTRASTGALASLHDRMPVFLEPGLMEDWLDPLAVGGRGLLDAVSEAAADLAEDLDYHAVSPAVGQVQNDFPELILPVG